MINPLVKLIYDNHKGCYFDPTWMKLFGDTLENFDAVAEIINDRKVYRLFRKDIVKVGNLVINAPMGDYKQDKIEIPPPFKEYQPEDAYFDSETFEHILI